MGLFDSQTRELNKQIVALQNEIGDLKAERLARQKEGALHAETLTLKEQIEQLKLEKGRIKEENEREKREVTHMVGLERKRQEFEAEQAMKSIETARKDAVLEVKTENLKVEREAFKKEMDFREKRFNDEVGYLKDLMTQILDRLPTVTVDRQITDATRTTTTTKV